MPSSVINSDDGVISGTSGIKTTGGDDGVLVFQSKGTETARINTDSQIVAAAGTASLPVITTTGDLNTGIFFPAADVTAVATDGTERMRINSSKLELTGGITFLSTISAGLNVLNTYTFNNNSVNSIGGGNSGFQIIYITQGNGTTAIPIFGNSGAGVNWTNSIFDPDAGTFSYGNTRNVSFATVGTGANSYTLSFSGGTAALTIQRTAGSAAYTVAVSFIGA
jgi:hypothetical protein